MTKRFPLLVYGIHFERWRALAFVLFVSALGLLLWAPPQLKAYQDVLWLAAGLGALIFVLGFALANLAFAAVGKQGLTLQLPLWRVVVPFAHMTVTRTAMLDQAAPGKWKDDEVAAMSALVIEVKQWSQPRPLLKLWLGRLVAANAIIVPVDDVIGLRRLVDAGLSQAKESQTETRKDEWPRY